jgi:hypothetical protein
MWAGSPERLTANLEPLFTEKLNNLAASECQTKPNVSCDTCEDVTSMVFRVDYIYSTYNVSELL